LIDEPVDARGKAVAPSSPPVPGRAGRMIAGWSANLLQMVLGITQQVALIPVFLQYWTGDALAAWLAIYAIGNLVFIADAGLQFRAINRFLQFKSCVDGDGRTARFYGAMLRIYLGLVAALTLLLLAGAAVLAPSTVFGFVAVAHFDAAFVVMAAGMLWTVPSNLVAALYRARGLYGRAVKVQNAAVLAGQFGQLAAIVATGSLLAVTLAYVASQLVATIWLLTVDAPRLFPYLRTERVTLSWRWIAGQFRKAFPFAVAGATDLALLNLPILMVSAFVSDRVAVAQWGLTRVVAGLLRVLCVQTTLPLAAELGHDHAMGDTQRLQSLYARGSMLVTLLASIVVSGLLPFWPDFFALWTHGIVPYDPVLTVTLLLGTAAAAPSILALNYANYSNRGGLLVRAKGLQLVVFLILAAALTPSTGLIGAAIAVIASELLIQFGVLGRIMLRKTLQHPLRHVCFLAAVMIGVTLAGWALGMAIRLAVPLAAPARFFAECGLWLLVVAIAASPLAIDSVRARLSAAIPH
jgi:O-antigen/teichoic acid export membrane protein